jgi:hypothetical protein
VHNDCSRERLAREGDIIVTADGGNVQALAVPLTP